MLTQLEQLINQVAEQKATALAAEQAELAKQNKGRLELATLDLRRTFGGLRPVLEPMLSDPEVETNKEGLIVAVEWCLHSDEQQIAPTLLRWGHKDSWANQEPTINAWIDVGGRTNIQFRNVTQESFAEVLYRARQGYSKYLAIQEAEREAEVQKRQQQRRAEIDNLTHWVWSVGWEEDYVLERVGRLKALGASDLAEQRLVEWRANVARDQAESKRREEQRAEAAAVRAEYDRQMAEWEAACGVWAEQEQARLWQPWTLWKVRYVPFDMSLIHAEYDEESSPEFIQEIYTLDDPAYIASQRAVVSLRRVKGDGTVTPGYAIACFLDAEPIHYNEPTANHHRCYWAGESVVCVPPFVSDKPVAAPVRPVYPSSIELESEDSPF